MANNLPKSARDRIRKKQEAGKDKPHNNLVKCPNYHGKSKQLFATTEEAEDFIKLNGKKLAYGGKTLRVYPCEACGGYHVTHKEYRPNKVTPMERYLALQEQLKQNKKNLAENRAKELWEDIPEEARLYPRKLFAKYCREELKVATNGNIYSHLVQIKKSYLEGGTQFV